MREFSPLTSSISLSPNHSGQRTMSLDRITPHCIVGQATEASCKNLFTSPSRGASSNYAISHDGKIVGIVSEQNRSWCSSSNANDQRAITIECASDNTDPYAFTPACYDALITLCIDICKAYGKKKLMWIEDKNTALAYQPKADEMLLTVHKWFENKACPGAWMYSRMSDLANKVTAALGDIPTPAPTPVVGLQATAFVNMSEANFLSTLGPLCTEDQKKSGILASVTMAQAIVESGWGKSDLAQGANNLFGMKTSLSGNSWPNSAWDGYSKFTKVTKEEYQEGVLTPVTADFRKYDCVEKSLADHSAYLSGAKNGVALRYEGLKGCTDYKTAIQIIKNGGYATSSTYVSAICSIIEKNNLTKFDLKDSVTATPTPEPAPVKDELYRVRKSWTDAKSQIGAYKILENAKKACTEGYSVYDSKGNIVYSLNSQSVTKSVTDLAKEVIDGKWGNGEDRKKKLTAAGYSYAEVQAEVNRMVAKEVKHVKAVSGLWLHNRATTSTSTRVICIPFNTEVAVKSVSGSMSQIACIVNGNYYSGYVASSYLG